MAGLSAKELRQFDVPFSLRYGEMAIALYAAPDLPYPERRRMAPQELAAYAEHGTTRLGGVDRVRSLYSRVHEANRDLTHDVIDEAFYEARLAAVLAEVGDAPDMRRFNRCIAYDLGRERAA